MDDLIISETGAGLVEYQQVFTVRLWEPGDYETPETVITYQPPDESVSVDLVVMPSAITVPSVLRSSDEALAAPKAPVYMSYFPLWLFMIIVFFVFASAIVGINTWQLRSRRRRVVQPEAVDVSVLGDRVLALLQKIDRTDPAAIYFLVDDWVREYLRANHDVCHQRNDYQ